MNYDKLLILKLLDGTDEEREKNYSAFLGSGITKDHFLNNPEYFEYVKTHKETYGTVPTRETFEQSFSLTAATVSEPLDFYFNEIRDTKRLTVLAEALRKSDDHFVKASNDPTGKELQKGIQVLEDAIRKVKFNQNNITDLHLGQTVQDRWDAYEKRIKNPGVDGIPSGFESLDKRTYGFHGGELTLLVAPPANMKTWTQIFMVKSALLAGFKVLMATVEMGRFQIARRIDAMITETRFENIRAGIFPSPQAIQDFKDNLFKTQGLPDCVVIGGVGFGEMFLRQKIEEYKPQIVYVDGMYLMNDEQGAVAHWEQMKNVSWHLKLIAQNYDIPIVATTQLSMKKKKGSTGDEDMSDIMYAQALSQNADNIVTTGKIYDDAIEDYIPQLWMKLVKLREGEPTKFKIEYDFNTMEVKESNSEFVESLSLSEDDPKEKYDAGAVEDDF